MSIRVSVVSDSLFYCICFLIGSLLELLRFVLIRVKIGVGYELQLAFCSVKVMVSSSN